jgi:hypothetical protein
MIRIEGIPIVAARLAATLKSPNTYRGPHADSAIADTADSTATGGRDRRRRQRSPRLDNKVCA